MALTAGIFNRRAGLSLAFPLTLCLGACQPSGTDASSEKAVAGPALTVTVATVQQQEAPDIVAATGTVAPWQELAVDAETSGLTVVEVRAHEGEFVRAGDVLVRFDDRTLRAQVAQQAGAVAEAQANLQSAKQEAARGDALVVQKAMSQEAVETRRTAILTSQAKLDQAKAALDQLQAQLAETVVSAPAGGVVSTDPIKIGAVAQAGAELLRIIRDGRLEVQAKIPENAIGRVRQGQSARVTGPDDNAFQASVRGVATKLDASTRLGVVYVSLPADSTLRAGMFAKVAITVATAQHLVVPEQALIWPDGKASAFVLGPDNKATLRTLTIGGRANGAVSVEAGLSDGERVVTSGAGFLHDGDPVRVAPALDATSAVSQR